MIREFDRDTILEALTQAILLSESVLRLPPVSTLEGRVLVARRREQITRFFQLRTRLQATGGMQEGAQ